MTYEPRTYTEPIGSLIKEYMNDRKIEIKKFASEHYPDLGRNTIASTEKLIGKYRQGHIYGEDSVTVNEYSRTRLARFLKLIGVRGNNEIIRRLKRNDPEFTYPPKKWETPTPNTDVEGLSLTEKVELLAPGRRAYIERMVERMTMLQE